MEKLLLDNSKQIVFFHDQQLIAIDLDGLARVLAEQNAVTNLDGQSGDFALVIALAGANCQHFALIRLFSGVVRDDDAGGCLGFTFNAFNDYAVGQRTQFHEESP